MAGEGEKSRETIRGVDIAFDDVEREIVEAAEGLGRDRLFSLPIRPGAQGPRPSWNELYRGKLGG
jgi:hypothetical protein